MFLFLAELVEVGFVGKFHNVSSDIKKLHVFPSVSSSDSDSVV